ncbi:MAG: hypothetical protein EA362_05790 [Saprospirales bacterium]|nr:MAG: hypothetical protein EA362_05790 [Saprospirales bacterium]
MNLDIRIYIFIIAALLTWVACAKSPDFDSDPYIEFVEIINNEIRQSSQADSVVFVIYFEDGDGNLRPPDGETPNVFLRDLRDSTIAFTFASPNIPTEGSGNGIRGTLRLRANILQGDVCCIYPTGQPPCTSSNPLQTDSIFYDLFLFDADGNQSNVIKAGPLLLVCD